MHFLDIWKAIGGTDKATSNNASHTTAFEACEEKAIGFIAHTISSHLKIKLNKFWVSNGKGFVCEAKSNELWAHLKDKFEKKDSISTIINYGCLTQAKLINNGILKE